MGDPTDFLKGLARAIGPDLLGLPADTIQNIVNLQRAGKNVLLHQLGLRKAEDLEPLAEKTAWGSDWLAEKTGLSDPGTSDYTAGRLTPFGVALARGASPQIAKMIEAATTPTGGRLGSQRGELLPKGNPQLMPSHQSDLGDALHKEVFPLELYSPSIGVTRDRLMQGFGGLSSDGGSFYAIPRPGAFDPAMHPSTLFNRDAYTARWHDYGGRRADDWGDFLRRADPNRDPEPEILTAAMARARLKDRLTPQSTVEARFREMEPGDDTQVMAIKASPAFRSFKQYENDPRGAGTLNSPIPSYAKDQRGAEAIDAYWAPWTERFPGQPLPGLAFNSNPEDFFHYGKELLAKEYLSPAAERAVIEMLDPRHFGKFKRAMATIPSDYAELKLHGPIPVTPNNWAGVIFSPGERSRGEYGTANRVGGLSPLHRVIMSLEDRGVPTALSLNPDSDIANRKAQELFDLAVMLQQKAGPVKGYPLK